MRSGWLVWVFCSLLSSLWGQQAYLFEGKVKNEQGAGLPAQLYLSETDSLLETGPRGRFVFSLKADSVCPAIVISPGYQSRQFVLQAGENILRLQPLSVALQEVEVGAAEEKSAAGYLRAVEGVAVYAAKKSELIRLENLQANLAANNAREIFRGVAGLNVWENDGAGLQLAIGARGLDPNRTSNFNTRQNGYDISADALGYPESYYTPPAQAIERIEVVRGAASLQYGTQFGGLLNFVLRDGPEDRPFEATSETTLGSFGFFNQTVTLGGQQGDLNYYAFYQYRMGNGWRDNSGFEQHTALTRLRWDISPRLQLKFDFTHMNYLSQQAGGLLDFEFEADPRRSKRERNWFRVDWNLAALEWEYRLSDRSRLNNRTFALFAERQALGELGPINRPDPLRNRDLIRGEYRNLGNETRFIHRYGSQALPHTLLLGLRLYRGFTRNRQGEANDGSAPDFLFLNPLDLEQSDYDFPSRNYAFFAENVFNLSPRLSLTPGLRAEHIRTASDGYYKYRVISGGEVIFERRFEDQRSNERSFLLLGLGASYRLRPELELYANFSQNYRSINFSDLAVVNPNLLIDSTLTDESGYNLELGLRGRLAGGLGRFDLSAFYLRYNHRIGLTEVLAGAPERLSTFRTNIGDAGIMGLEAYGEFDLLQYLRGPDSPWSLRPFLNLSLIRGRYLSGANAIIGNQVELIPPFSLKTGFDLQYQELKLSALFTYLHRHYSDATNAVLVSDATRGLIPSYQVVDLSLSYEWKRFRLSAGLNNLLDRAYFTRRATGYPGPGIIPAEGRRGYVGLRVVL